MTPEEREQLTALADQRRAEVDAEYGEFVAAQDITFNGVLAYPKGAPVPVSNVKEHGYLTHGLVETAAAAAARRDMEVEAAAEAEAARKAELDAQWQEALARVGADTVSDAEDDFEPVATEPAVEVPSSTEAGGDEPVDEPSK